MSDSCDACHSNVTSQFLTEYVTDENAARNSVSCRATKELLCDKKICRFTIGGLLDTLV